MIDSYTYPRLLAIGTYTSDLALGRANSSAIGVILRSGAWKAGAALRASGGNSGWWTSTASST